MNKPSIKPNLIETAIIRPQFSQLTQDDAIVRRLRNIQLTFFDCIILNLGRDQYRAETDHQKLSLRSHDER